MSYRKKTVYRVLQILRFLYNGLIWTFPEGIPAEYIEKARDAKVHTEISKDGDVITVKRTRPAGTTTNSFKLGEETELDTIKGDKIKVTVFYTFEFIWYYICFIYLQYLQSNSSNPNLAD